MAVAVGMAVGVGVAVGLVVAVMVGAGGGVTLSLFRLHAAIKVMKTDISNATNRICLEPSWIGAHCVPGNEQEISSICAKKIRQIG